MVILCTSVKPLFRSFQNVLTMLIKFSAPSFCVSLSAYRAIFMYVLVEWKKAHVQLCAAALHCKYFQGRWKKRKKKKSCVQVKLHRELPVGRQNIITSWNLAKTFVLTLFLLWKKKKKSATYLITLLSTSSCEICSLFQPKGNIS